MQVAHVLVDRTTGSVRVAHPSSMSPLAWPVVGDDPESAPGTTAGGTGMITGSTILGNA